MRIGPVEITFGKKSYNDLVTMLRREQTGGVANLKTQPKVQLAEYKSWVSSCVTLISDRVSTLPYSFYNKSTGEEPLKIKVIRFILSPSVILMI